MSKPNVPFKTRKEVVRFIESNPTQSTDPEKAGKVPNGHFDVQWKDRDGKVNRKERIRSEDIVQFMEAEPQAEILLFNPSESAPQQPQQTPS